MGKLQTRLSRNIILTRKWVCAISRITDDLVSPNLRDHAEQVAFLLTRKHLNAVFGTWFQTIDIALYMLIFVHHKLYFSNFY